jgi:transposase
MTTAAVPIGVGIDTARYGHHVSFVREDFCPAAKPFTFQESHAGYGQLQQALEQLQKIHGAVHFHIRIDAAGQYSANLEQFVRSLRFDKTVSIGQPKQNRDYRNVHFPKRKADSVDSYCCARFALAERPGHTPETPSAYLLLRDTVAVVEADVKQRTRLINQLHNRLARAFPELALIAPDISAAWVLRLLWKYPTPDKIAAASLDSLRAIPFMPAAKPEALQAAARETTACISGPVVEALIRQSVRELRQKKASVITFRRVMTEAYNALPAGPHQQIITIPGIGVQTAAALVAKIVSIDRFATPESLVNYFGVFPEECSSGTNKSGRPLPPGTMRMSLKGNNLVRGLLWNAARVGIRTNPMIRALYARQKQRGKRGDVALGHCMQKLLHLVYAVWKTNRPFVAPKQHEDEVPEAPAQETKSAEGRKGRSPHRKAVTPASGSISEPCGKSTTETAASAPRKQRAARLDFAELRQQVSMEQVLRALNWWDRLNKGGKAQRRGPCPIHDAPGKTGHCFSVNLDKNIFQCFDTKCAAKGNVLDLWAKVHGTAVPEAARDLADRLGIAQE